MHPKSKIDTPNTLDLNAIRQIVNDVQEGFNTNNGQLMNAHVADDAIIVNARGAVLAGRAAIEKSTEEALSAGFLRDATAYYELTDAVALSHDVITGPQERMVHPAGRAARQPTRDERSVHLRSPRGPMADLATAEHRRCVNPYPRQGKPRGIAARMVITDRPTMPRGPSARHRRTG